MPLVDQRVCHARPGPNSNRGIRRNLKWVAIIVNCEPLRPAQLDAVAFQESGIPGC